MAEQSDLGGTRGSASASVKQIMLQVCVCVRVDITPIWGLNGLMYGEPASSEM